jgi:hypothetical protein
MRDPQTGDIYINKNSAGICYNSYIKIIEILRDENIIKYIFLFTEQFGNYLYKTTTDVFYARTIYIPPEEYTNEVKMLLAEEMIKDIIE